MISVRKKRIAKLLLEEQLDERLSDIKAKIREDRQKGIRFDYIQVALEAFPDLDTVKGGFHIQNVWKGNSYNESLIEAWESKAGIEFKKPAEVA